MDLLLNNTIKCYCLTLTLTQTLRLTLCGQVFYNCTVAACNRTSTLIVISKFLTLQSGVYNLELEELHVEMDGQKVKGNCEYIPSCTKSQTCICLGHKKILLICCSGG